MQHLGFRPARRSSKCIHCEKELRYEWKSIRCGVCEDWLCNKPCRPVGYAVIPKRKYESGIGSYTENQSVAVCRKCQEKYGDQITIVSS